MDLILSNPGFHHLGLGLYGVVALYRQAGEISSIVHLAKLLTNGEDFKSKATLSFTRLYKMSNPWIIIQSWQNQFKI